VFFLAFCMVALAHWPLRLPRHFIAWWILLVLLITLCAWSAWDALRTRPDRMRAATHWWALLVLPIALMTATVHGNWLLVAAGLHIYGIPSTSMEPTIDRGDQIVVDLRAYRGDPPHFGDIVVFHKDSQQLVKRVIAVGGQHRAR
jgi:hypothetical protein